MMFSVRFIITYVENIDVTSARDDWEQQHNNVVNLSIYCFISNNFWFWYIHDTLTHYRTDVMESDFSECITNEQYSKHVDVNEHK